MNISNIYKIQKGKYHRKINSFLFKNIKRRKFVSKQFPILFSYYYYYKLLGQFPNLRNPKDLNEKLMVLKLKEYRQNQYISDCADKYKVRNVIQQKGYRYILSDLLGVYDYPEEINFDGLPDKFVIKMNHGCGYNIICINKKEFDFNKAVFQLNKWRKEIYGLDSGEWQYRRIKPLIIVEKYLEELSSQTLVDYKFHCFNGFVHSCLICYDRDEEGNAELDHYKLNFERTNSIKPKYRINRREIEKPSCWNEMIKVAGDLSKGFKYVRVDLYSINGSVIFGEFSFTPYACILEYYEQSTLDEMGALVQI